MPDSSWKRAFATHEEAQSLSTGPWLGDSFPGVALPSRQARLRWIMLRHNNLYTCAQVVDVGPWCIDDDDYVFGSSKPRAEIYLKRHCPYSIAQPYKQATLPDGEEVELSNGAGIDLFPYTAKQLGIPANTNTLIEWRFIDC